MPELFGSYRATDLRFLILMKMPVICFKLVRNNKHGKMGYSLYVVSCSEKIFVASLTVAYARRACGSFCKISSDFTLSYTKFLCCLFLRCLYQ